MSHAVSLEIGNISNTKLSFWQSSLEALSVTISTKFACIISKWACVLLIIFAIKGATLCVCNALYSIFFAMLLGSTSVFHRDTNSNIQGCT